MIIPFNYLAIINSIGELMQDSHCATLVFSTALDFLSMFFLTNQNPFASSKSCSVLIVPFLMSHVSPLQRMWQSRGKCTMSGVAVIWLG